MGKGKPKAQKQNPRNTLIFLHQSWPTLNKHVGLDNFRTTVVQHQNKGEGEAKEKKGVTKPKPVEPPWAQMKASNHRKAWGCDQATLTNPKQYRRDSARKIATLGKRDQRSHGGCARRKWNFLGREEDLLS